MMKPDFIFILAIFWALLIWTVTERSRLKALFSRTRGQWAVDFFGLVMHGTVVPLFQMWIIYRGFSAVLPSFRGIIDLPAIPSFLVAFVLIDYVYYWNHRWLHSKGLWRFHATHHSGPTFDVFTTSRNSAITTFLIIYVWINGSLLFLLRDPSAFAWGVAVGNGLDILRHSGLTGWLDFAPFNWIISPRDHAWHHSEEVMGVNFGANLCFWDRLHGTYHRSAKLPEKIGSTLSTDLWSAFWKGAP